jgi:AbrB family looped-hinge helix DNA binding protein
VYKDAGKSIIKRFDNASETDKGLITLPKQIREQFGIVKGDYLTVSAEGGKIVFRKVKMKIDWENSDDVWQGCGAKLLADD